MAQSHIEYKSGIHVEAPAVPYKDLMNYSDIALIIANRTVFRYFCA